MRWLRRFLIAWGLGLPIFYFLILPALLEQTQNKLRVDTLADCERQYAAVNGPAPSSLTVEMTDKFCHCVADNLIFTRDDLLDMAQRKQPAALQVQIKTQADTCAQAREEYMSKQSLQPALILDEQGREVSHP